MQWAVKARRVLRRVLRRGSKKGLSRRHLEGRSTPFREYDPVGVCPILVFSARPNLGSFRKLLGKSGKLLGNVWIASKMSTLRRGRTSGEVRGKSGKSKTLGVSRRSVLWAPRAVGKQISLEEILKEGFGDSGK